MLTDILRYLSPLAQPLDIVWLLCLLGMLILLKKRQWVGSLLFLVIAAIISVVGSRVSLNLQASLERPYVRRSFVEIPVCDAVVMLGGAHTPSTDDLIGMNVNDASDRILTAVELVRRKKAATLVLGGGSIRVNGKLQPEGRSLKNWLQSWDVISDPIFVLEGSLNTHEEAEKVKTLAGQQGWKQIALVTSAYHMKRAEAVFKQAGLKVVPVGCDFCRLEKNKEQINIFPSLDGFVHFDIYLHEKIGWWVYRARGWIGSEAATAKTNVQAEKAK